VSLFQRQSVIVQLGKVKLRHEALEYSNGLYTLCGLKVPKGTPHLDALANCEACKAEDAAHREPMGAAL